MLKPANDNVPIGQRLDFTKIDRAIMRVEALVNSILRGRAFHEV